MNGTPSGSGAAPRRRDSLCTAAKPAQKEWKMLDVASCGENDQPWDLVPALPDLELFSDLG